MTRFARIALSLLLAAASFEVASEAAAQQPLPARIKIGILDTLTGGGATGSAGATQPALKLAIKELQDAGGTLAGRPVDFVWADSQSDPTQAVNEARRLVQREHVNAMIGPFSAAFTIPTAPIYTEAKIASVISGTSSAMTPQLTPYGFVGYYDSGIYMRFMADYAINTLKAKSVAILASGGAADVQAVEDFKKAAGERNLTIVGIEQHEVRATDITPQMLRLRRANPDVLISNASFPEDGALHIKTMNEMGWKVPVLSSLSVLLAGSYLKLVGPDVFKGENIHGITFNNFTACKNVPLGEPVFAKFLARMKAFDPQNFDRMFQQSLTIMYDSAKLLFAAIDATKSVDGPTVAAWIEANNANFPAVSGKMGATKTNHFLFGGDALWMVTRPDVKRADGLLNKPGC